MIGLLLSLRPMLHVGEISIIYRKTISSINYHYLITDVNMGPHGYLYINESIASLVIFIEYVLIIQTSKHRK